MTGSIGLPSQNGAGYREYRPEFLKLGTGSGSFSFTCRANSQLVKIDCNAGTILATIHSTGTATAGESPLTIKNSDASSVIDVYDGRVHLDADTSGATATLRITPADGAQPDVLASTTFACGAVQQSGGRFECRGSATSLTASNGALATFTGAATCPTISAATGAIVTWGSTAGVTTTITAFPGGTITFVANGAAKTVADATIHPGGAIRDPLGIVAWTDGIELAGCALEECTIDVGRGKKIDTI
jgi:hypothetical protein